MRKCECGYVLVASEEPEPMRDALIHYARPLLQRFPGDLTFEEFKAVIDFAAFLWNLAAPDDIPQAVRHLEREMPLRLRIDAPKGLAVIRTMLTRRSVEYAHDPRLALQVEVRRRGDRISVKALGVRFEPGTSGEGLPCGDEHEMEPKARRVLH
jgi:hypothetical protein